jgi:septal ring factor EnvC (AmiA/AmiB activator)
MRRAALLVIAFSLAGAAAAQTIEQERRALATAKAASRAATERSRVLERQAEQALDDAAKARRREAAVAARIQAAEAEIAIARSQVALIDRLRRAQQQRIAAQQEPIARLVAALQTLSRRPAAVAIVQPGSLTDLVHVRLLLGHMLPVVAERTRSLRAEAAQGARLRAAAADALAALRQGQARLNDERLTLARLEVDHRRRSRTLANSASFEAERAIALSEQARDVAGLLDQLGRQATVRDQLIALPGPLPRPARPGTDLPAAGGGTVNAPRRPRYRLPVLGRVVAGLGEMSATGVRSSGITLATAPAAQVVAPTSGRIAFAGPFRGYGRIAIIDHGGGWTSLITGLDRLSVAVGDLVEQGSPIGRTGSDRPTVTVELRRDGKPVDIARLVG